MGTTDSNDYRGRHRPDNWLLAAAMRHVSSNRDDLARMGLYTHEPRHNADFRGGAA